MSLRGRLSSWWLIALARIENAVRKMDFSHAQWRCVNYINGINFLEEIVDFGWHSTPNWSPESEFYSSMNNMYQLVTTKILQSENHETSYQRLTWRTTWQLYDNQMTVYQIHWVPHDWEHHFLITPFSFGQYLSSLITALYDLSFKAASVSPWPSLMLPLQPQVWFTVVNTQHRVNARCFCRSFQGECSHNRSLGMVSSLAISLTK